MENSYHDFLSWAPLIRAKTSTPMEASWTHRAYLGDRQQQPIPVLCLAGLHGDQDMYRCVFTSLAPKQYSIYALDLPSIPSLTSVKDFCLCLEAWMSQVKIARAHFVGVHLGGYLSQAMAELRPHCVVSLSLYNSFLSTQHFYKTCGMGGLSLAWYKPAPLLRNPLLEEVAALDDISPGIHHVLFDALSQLRHEALYTRVLLLNIPHSIGQVRIEPWRIMVVYALDDTLGVPVHAEQMQERYATSRGTRVAQMRRGGTYPNLVNPGEFVLLLEVHIRNINQREGEDIL